MAELTVFPVTNGDGMVDRSNETTWAAARDATDGDNAYDGDSVPSANDVGRSVRVSASATPLYDVERSFYPFDTSALGASANISAAILSLKN